MITKKIITHTICLFLTMYSCSLLADENSTRGRVLKVSGDVEVINDKGEKRTVDKAGEPVNEMDTIVTREGARVVVQFNDDALSVLDEKSRLRVENTSWFSYLGGKVYFTFKKVFGDTRHIKTRAATIGIRGTTFIISENSEQNGESVALKEGLLEIQSIGPAFEIHKKIIADDFEQYRQDQQRAQEELQDEFARYRQQAMSEFVEYRRNFIMQPNRIINLSGYRIDETTMTSANEADFESFESETEDLSKNPEINSIE